MASEFRPMIIPRITISPGRDLHGLALEIDNTPGSLNRVLTALARLGINLVQVSVAPLEVDSPSAPAYIAMDMTGVTTPVNDILEELRGLPNVRWVGHIPPTLPGYLTDRLQFPLLLPGGMRLIAASEVFWRSILETGYRTFGPEGMATFLYYLGEATGRRLAQHWRGVLGVEGEPLANVLLENGLALGWWRGEVRFEGPEKITVVLLDNWEGQYSGKWAPGCHLVRGLWQGFLGEALGREVKLVEELCVSRGDEACRLTTHRVQPDEPKP